MTSNYIKDITVAFELYESVRLENERLQQRIDELRDGSCRYNCRTARQVFDWAFEEGWNEGIDYYRSLNFIRSGGEEAEANKNA